MNEHTLPSWISFRVKPEEYNKIHRLFSKSSYRKFSEYARNVLLQKPVFIKTRNASADQFLEEMIAIKKELNAIGNNYDQVVKKLHTLNHINELNSWLKEQDAIHQNITDLTQNIFEKMNAIHKQWLSE